MSSKSKTISSSKGAAANAPPVLPVDNSLLYLLKLIAIVWQVLILYYIYNLEGADCKCSIDWRTDNMHSVIKYLTMAVIGLNVITLFIKTSKALNILLVLADIVNLILFFIYINNQNENKCSCAVEKQYKLNYLLELYAWVRLLAIVFGFIFIAYGLYILYKMKKQATKK